MSNDRQQDAWGGEVGPRWLRRLFQRSEPPEDTPEAAHERRKPQSGPSPGANVDRAAFGALSDLYREGRTKRR